MRQPIFKAKTKSSITETLLKIVPLLFSLIGIGIGLFQYNQNYRREIRKISYNTTFNIYQEFIEHSAILSQVDKDSTKTNSFNIEYKQFERIYYGKLLLVQDSTVSSKATDFFIVLNNFRQKSSPTSNSDLEIALYDLINSAKESLKIIQYEDNPF